MKDRIVPLTTQERRQLKDGDSPCRVLRASRGDGITQPGLAAAIGMDASHKSYISRLESCEFVGSVAVWHKICRHFNASLDEIAPFIPEDGRRASNRKK